MPPAAASPRPRDGAPLMSELTTVFRGWRTLGWCGLGGMVAALAIAFAAGNRYTAKASFTLQSERRSELAGVAAQFGINLGPWGARESPVFYSRLIKSRDLLRELATQHYRVPSRRNGADTVSGTLLSLYGAEGKTPEDQLNAFLRRLERDIYVAVDTRAEIVTLKVTSRWPLLAEALARQILGLVNQFNLEKRQSRARAEREFLERRLREARQELGDAETRQVDFLRHNARYQDSPELRLRAAQLQREVDFRQQVVSSLAQAYEEARLNEVRDTPVITVLEQPEGTAEPARSIVLLGVVGLLAGLFGGLTVVLAQRRLRALRGEYPESYAELVVAWRDFRRRFSMRRT